MLISSRSRKNQRIQFFMNTISSKLALLCLFGFLSSVANAATYYSKISGNANTLSTWGLNSDGAGAAPSNFTTAGDLFILRSGATLNLSSNWSIGSGVTLQVDGNISVTNNNHDITISGTIIFSDAASTQVSLTGGGNGNSFTVSANGTLKTSNQNGLRGSNSSLPVTASGSINLNTNASYEFIGSSSQLTTGMPTQVKDLVVNNGSIASLSTSTTITGQLKLLNGVLNLSPGVVLTIPSPSDIVGSGFSNTKHINTGVSGASKSYVRVNSISGSVTIPTGDGSNYLPITINSSSISDVQFNVFSGLTLNGIPNGSAFSSTQKANSVDAVYTLQRMAGAGSFDLTLGWNAALEGPQFSSLANSEIGIATNNGSSWNIPLGSGNQTANTATLTGIANMGVFAVGKSGIPLYVKFGSIIASLKNNSVSLKWETLTELDLQKFVIERSADGIQFSAIGEQAALAANYTGFRYEFNDLAPLTGISYYRLRSIETYGKISYSAILRISNSSLSGASLKLYPNPVINKELNIQGVDMKQGAYQLMVTDLNGKQLFSQLLNVTASSFNRHIQLPASITKGNYILLLRGNGENSNRLFSVQ